MKKFLLQGKRILFISMSILLVVVAILICKGNVYANTSAKQETRTVSYKEKEINSESLFEDFDNHKLKETDEGFEIVATKTFDSSIFEGIDLVGLEDGSEYVSIRYETVYSEEEETMLLKAVLNNGSEEPFVDTIPGLVTYNHAGDPDVMFNICDEYVWLSDIQQTDHIEETGWFANLFKKVVTTVAKAVAPIIRLATTTLYLTGKGPIAALIGATLLDMNQEFLGIIPTGIYHARFNCWQKDYGYDDFYDEVFDYGTRVGSQKRMTRHKYEIDMDYDKPNHNNKPEYIIWAWKGDYYNLGAGCELGIYERVTTQYFGERWRVNTNIAMNITLKLKFKNKEIINYSFNGKRQWWATGFNSNYQFPVLWDIDDLTASFDVTFNPFGENDSRNEKFYKSLRFSERSAEWSNFGKIKINRNSYYTATLSF